MCGIFGIIGPIANFGLSELKGHINFLFSRAATRGMDAAGIAYLDRGNAVRIVKAPIPAPLFIRSNDYHASFSKMDEKIAIFGHSRLVTNGALEDNENNQPVSVTSIIGVHNGIVTNDEEIWALNKDIKREKIVDTESLFALIDKNMKNGNSIIHEAVESAFNSIEGNASIAMFYKNQNLVLATNNGSIYYAGEGDTHCFASERYMIKEFLQKRGLSRIIPVSSIRQIRANSSLVIDLSTMRAEMHGFSRITDKISKSKRRASAASREFTRILTNGTDELKFRRMEEEFDDTFARKLLRCTKCLLPSSFPFINFDKHGVCNFCRQHKPPLLLGSDKLDTYLSRFRSNNQDKPDCIVAVSGGRDSIYGLHYLKKEMGMNPIAYTYDWGMVTDLARRNIARITGELGIEHVLVSADIRKKRTYIRKNLEAWLKRPSLGMIPILMAGDKKFKYYGMSLQKLNNIALAVYCAGNRFEKTNFKTGFCGVSEGETNGTLTLSLLNVAKLFGFYGKEYLLNPGYLNSSLIDTIAAYYYSYVMPKDYIYLYHYIDWNEPEVLKIIEDLYNWERAEDTAATWRIGDGTACFYNYLYYRIAGFSEFDTYRSNQIREGRMNREVALDLVIKENRPRFRAIKTYLDLIGLDFDEVMNIVNSVQKLYLNK